MDDEESLFLLLTADHRAASGLRTRLSDAWLIVRVGRGRKMRDWRGLFDEFAAAMQFPWYFGENLDAFNECICDLDWLPPGTGYVIIVTEPVMV